jgi:hypothetical protein
MAQPERQKAQPAQQPAQPTLAAACAARAQQVEWMVAAAPSARTVRTARTRAAWATRHVVHMALTVGYTETQARMLFLPDVDPRDRFAAFERECLQRCLAPTTALTYWTAWISAAAALALPTDVAADTRTMRLLKSRATRFPVAFPPPMTVLEVQQLLAQRRSTITTLIVTSWTLGQRISDTLQWAATDLHEETPSGTLIVTVRRGKTMSVSPPYILALPAGPSHGGAEVLETQVHDHEVVPLHRRQFSPSARHSEATRSRGPDSDQRRSRDQVGPPRRNRWRLSALRLEKSCCSRATRARTCCAGTSTGVRRRPLSCPR